MVKKGKVSESLLVGSILDFLSCIFNPALYPALRWPKSFPLFAVKHVLYNKNCFIKQNLPRYAEPVKPCLKLP